MTSVHITVELNGGCGAGVDLAWFPQLTAFCTLPLLNLPLSSFVHWISLFSACSGSQYCWHIVYSHNQNQFSVITNLCIAKFLILVWMFHMTAIGVSLSEMALRHAPLHCRQLKMKNGSEQFYQTVWHQWKFTKIYRRMLKTFCSEVCYCNCLFC